jgi:hypothetical protein
MSASQPATRAEFKAWCLRRLGYPAIDINVCDEQLDDLIDEAVSHYQEFHYEGSYRTLLKIEVTENMKSAATSSTQITGTNWYEANPYVELPPGVQGVDNVFTQVSSSSSIPGNIFNIKYQLFLNDIYAFTNNQILHYYMVQNYLETLDWVTNSRLYKRLRYTANTNKLYVDIDWSELGVGEYIVVDCVMGVDPVLYPKTWNEHWLKDYATALFKEQWGQNLSKYDGIQMLGGVTLNGRKILEEAKEEIKDLKEELRSTFELPPMDLIG